MMTGRGRSFISHRRKPKPSSSGISKSRVMTCGFSFTVFAIASMPLEAVPTTSISPSDSSIPLIVCLLYAESSTMSTLILLDMHARSSIGGFRVYDIVFQMDQGKGGRDVHEGFRVAEQQVAPVGEAIVEVVDDLLPRLVIEVDQHVSAEYHIHLADESRLAGVQQVEVAETDQLFHPVRDR